MINSLQKQPKKTVPLIKLVMVARFSAQKDHNLLFQALSMINNKNWSLDLIGGGEDSDKVGLLLKQYKIEKHVNLIGQINNVDEVLYEYDIFLLISKWEGFPRSILEAMRTGLPVIASDVGGVNESVIDSKGGFLVPRGDVTSLIQCLQKLMGCSKLRSTMGEFNRSRFVEEFTFEAMYQKNINLYNEVLLSCKKF
jgi:glycosyltransferase involved in cell wall biosynthesis